MLILLENTNKVERYDVIRNLWEFMVCIMKWRYRPPGVTWDRCHDTIESCDPGVDIWTVSSGSWLSTGTVALTNWKDLGKEKV